MPTSVPADLGMLLMGGHLGWFWSAAMLLNLKGLEEGEIAAGFSILRIFSPLESGKFTGLGRFPKLVPAPSAGTSGWLLLLAAASWLRIRLGGWG